MNLKQFNELVAADYNRIPLLREVNADLDTPLSIYLKLASESNTYLFESMQGGEKWGVAESRGDVGWCKGVTQRGVWGGADHKVGVGVSTKGVGQPSWTCEVG